MTLVQEPEDVCFGDTVTLTCSVIDDGGAPTLRWQSVNESFKDTYSRHSSPGANVSFILGFAIILTNKSGNMLTSTATLTNASESVTLMCTDGRGNTKKSNIVIIQSRLQFHKCTPCSVPYCHYDYCMHCCCCIPLLVNTLCDKYKQYCPNDHAVMIDLVVGQRNSA